MDDNIGALFEDFEADREPEHAFIRKIDGSGKKHKTRYCEGLDNDSASASETAKQRNSSADSGDEDSSPPLDTSVEFLERVSGVKAEAITINLVTPVRRRNRCDDLTEPPVASPDGPTVQCDVAEAAPARTTARDESFACPNASKLPSQSDRLPMESDSGAEGSVSEIDNPCVSGSLNGNSASAVSSSTADRGLARTRNYGCETEAEGSTQVEVLKRKLRACVSELETTRKENERLTQLTRHIEMPRTLGKNEEGPVFQVLFMNNFNANNYRHEVEALLGDLMRRDTTVISPVMAVNDESKKVSYTDVCHERGKLHDMSAVLGCLQIFRQYSIDMSGHITGSTVPSYDRAVDGFIPPTEEENEEGLTPKPKQGKSRRQCFNCGGDHNLYECVEAKDFAAIRRNKAEFLNRQSSSQLKSRRQCFNCGGDHNLYECVEAKDFAAIRRNKAEFLNRQSKSDDPAISVHSFTHPLPPSARPRSPGGATRSGKSTPASSLPSTGPGTPTGGAGGSTPASPAPDLEGLEEQRMLLLRQLAEEASSVVGSGDDGDASSDWIVTSLDEGESDDGRAGEPPVTPVSSRSIAVELGTPAVRHSPAARLPTATEFARGISEHLPHENLPGATGTFGRLREVLGTIRSKFRRP
ncbi:PREDICTED: uncharacterized protein LOC106813767 [Priapulus caudatus]|uniref:Uncharacterized protein LOC106813767 n=1 Tax=Priapulus caudatus TaxID=37621 RepID=A0ABM1EMQ3_PRICU|nr:PREDICTED: uncharacterized protein LOC106813767 [Priapulus caudatus]